MTTAEVAEYLRTVADRLESNEEFTLEAGTVSVTLTPPNRIEFEVTELGEVDLFVQHWGLHNTE
jgi:amphi-Trp domain-containing protein